VCSSVSKSLYYSLSDEEEGEVEGDKLITTSNVSYGELFCLDWMTSQEDGSSK